MTQLDHSFMPLRSALPAGLPFVLPTLPFLLVPPLSVYAVTYFVNLPSFAFILLEVLSLPLALSVYISLKSLRDHRAAARFNAILPPSLDGVKLGNIDILSTCLHAWKHGYIGMYYLIRIHRAESHSPTRRRRSCCWTHIHGTDL